MKSLRYLLTMAAVSLFTVACVEEVPYEPGQPDADGCYGVYFPTQESAFVVDPSDEPFQTLTVKRTNSVGEITVPVEVVTSAEGVFEIAPITFADGQDETTFTVSYKTAEVGTTYKVSIAITDPQYASKYNDGAVAIDVSVLREKWNSLGKATYIDHYLFDNEYKAELLQNELKPYKFRLIDPVSEGLEAEGYYSEGLVKTGPSEMFEFEIIQIPYVFYPGKEYEFTVKTKDLVYHAPFKTGLFHPTYSSEVWYYHASAIVDDETGLYENKVLGYQENGLPTAVHIAPFARLTDYGTGGSGFDYTAETDFVTIVFPGAVLVDYSLDVTADYAVEGVTSVEFEAGADVAEISYVVIEGEANPIVREETVAALVAGKAENSLTITSEDMYLDEETGVKYAYADVTCPKTGAYTLVAVAFDAEGTAQTGAYDVFDFVASTDDSYDVTLSVEVEDTPSRFEADGHTPYNSFAFSVYGGNKLTDVKIGVYPSADVEKYGMDVIVSDLRYEDEKYNSSVLPDTLARINTVAGYTDVVTDLSDDTAYTLVVWGTNGMQTKVVCAEYKTLKNPEVFKSLGKAQFTDALISTWFQEDPVTYEVEVEESVDNPGKYRLVNPYGEAYPYNEEGDWDAENDYYLILDATDPDYVNVLPSSLGIDWGYGMMETMSYADLLISAGVVTEEEAKSDGLYGTLKDGVISFAEQTVVIVDDESAGLGTIKVVLPSVDSDDEPAEETADVSSLSRASVKNVESAIRVPMSKGRIAGVKIESKIRTVAVSVSLSDERPAVTAIDQNEEIATFEVRKF